MLIDFCKTLESVRTLLELLKASTKEITNDPSKFPTVQRELVYLLQTCPSLVLSSLPGRTGHWAAGQGPPSRAEHHTDIRDVRELREIESECDMYRCLVIIIIIS